MNTPITAYLAGPDLFLPGATTHAERKLAIAVRYGISGLAPLDTQTSAPRPGEALWQAIFRHDIGMMTASDIVIANLTPFRGASADAGTLVELGWFLGRGKPCFGYSNSAAPFAARSRAQQAVIPDPVAGTTVEDFDLGDNLMVVGALACGLVIPPDGQDLPFDSLLVFERCVAKAAAFLAGRSTPE